MARPPRPTPRLSTSRASPAASTRGGTRSGFRAIPSALAGPLVALIGTRMPDPAARPSPTRLAASSRATGCGCSPAARSASTPRRTRARSMAAGRTVVVLPAAGSTHWYPRRHAALYRAIVASGGCARVAVSAGDAADAVDLSPAQRARRHARDVMVVVQAPDPSGALLAAEAARRWAGGSWPCPPRPSIAWAAGQRAGCCVRARGRAPRRTTYARRWPRGRRALRGPAGAVGGADGGGDRGGGRGPRVRAHAASRAPVQSASGSGAAQADGGGGAGRARGASCTRPSARRPVMSMRWRGRRASARRGSSRRS
jgi:hypothetical protein